MYTTASRRIAAALLGEDIEGQWTKIGKLCQDIETIKSCSLPGQDANLQPLILLLYTALQAKSEIDCHVQWPVYVNGLRVTDISLLQALRITALNHSIPLLSLSASAAGEEGAEGGSGAGGGQGRLLTVEEALEILSEQNKAGGLEDASEEVVRYGHMHAGSHSVLSMPPVALQVSRIQ